MQFVLILCSTNKYIRSEDETPSNHPPKCWYERTVSEKITYCLSINNCLFSFVPLLFQGYFIYIVAVAYTKEAILSLYQIQGLLS